MKTSICVLLLVLTHLKASSQSDSITRLVKSKSLFLVVDSISNQLERLNKPLVLIYSQFSVYAQTSVIIWKDGDKYCGYYYQEVEAEKHQRSTNQEGFSSPPVI